MTTTTYYDEDQDAWYGKATPKRCWPCTVRGAGGGRAVMRTVEEETAERMHVRVR